MKGFGLNSYPLNWIGIHKGILASLNAAEKLLNSSGEFSWNIHTLLTLKLRKFIFLGGNTTHSGHKYLDLICDMFW